jgi:hypothetical protein
MTDNDSFWASLRSTTPPEATLEAAPPPPTSRWKVVAGAVASLAIAAALGVGAYAVFGDDATPAATTSKGIVDDFERADAASMGKAGSHTEWEAVTGSFGVADGRAIVTESNPTGPRTIAVVDVGATNAHITAEAGRLANGWGLVFRFVDPFNYWYIQAAPQYAVYNVVRVSEGIPEQMGKSILAATADGCVVELKLHGALIEIDVNGQLVFTATNDHALGATRAGLISYGPEGIDATWERFTAEPDRDDPGPSGLVLEPPRRSDQPTTTTTTESLPVGGLPSG